MATVISTRDVGLNAGEARHEHLELELTPHVSAGLAYEPVTSPVPARLDITAMTRGLSFRLRFAADFDAACVRCLADTIVHVEVDQHEVHDADAEPAPDDELDDPFRSDFVDDDRNELDVTAWAMEAVNAEFPTRVLCARGEQCQGLCPVCGVDRNEQTCDCDTTSRDSRWDALKTLKLDD